MIRLCSYNIQNGLQAREIIKNIQKVVSLHTDVICLQEVRQLPNREFIGNQIQHALSSTWKTTFFLGENPLHDAGLCILWNSQKYNLIETTKVNLPRLASMSLVEKILLKAKSPPQRGALVGTFAHKGTQFRVTNLHLDWQGGIIQRLKQLTFVKKYLRENSSVKYEIVCGDFNTVGTAKYYKERIIELQNILGADFKESFPTLDATWEFKNSTPYYGAKFLHQLLLNLKVNYRQRLDYIWYKGFKLGESKVFRLFGSDHYLLMASLV